MAQKYSHFLNHEHKKSMFYNIFLWNLLDKTSLSRCESAMKTITKNFSFLLKKLEFHVSIGVENQVGTQVYPLSQEDDWRHARQVIIHAG